MKRVDILNFEWRANSRDTNIIEPVLCYIEQKYGLNVVRESYNNYMLKLFNIRPRMILLSNYTGAPENFLLAKQAHKMGILVVSLISEGNVTSEELAENFFWGWNIKKEKVVDLLLLWSNRTKDIFNRLIPESRGTNIVVSGATGFDSYKFLQFMQKDEFLKKYGKNQKKVIGIAAWGFELVNLDGKSLTGRYPYTVEESEYLLYTKKLINELYEKLISNNPDMLFILKYHPGNVECPEKTEFVGLSKFDNVVEIGRQEQISDLINVSDIWISFESTTTLEAWLLGTSTIVVNPLGKEFPRAQIYDGSVELHSVNEVQQALDEFYDTGIIEGFERKSDTRKSICEEIIQYDDGRNHVRASEAIIRCFEENNVKICKPAFTLFALKEIFVEMKYDFLSRIPQIKNVGKIKKYNSKVNPLYNLERRKETKRYTEAVVRYNGLN